MVLILTVFPIDAALVRFMLVLKLVLETDAALNTSLKFTIIMPSGAVFIDKSSGGVVSTITLSVVRFACVICKRLFC